MARNKKNDSLFLVNPETSAVKVSEKMGGKMYGIPAISTLCTINPFCLARMKNGAAVCAQCFAEATTNQYSDLRQNLEYNTLLLSGSVLPVEVLPRFKRTVRIARFEAFGDLMNVTHAINYINIAKLNPHVNFTLWTKNHNFIKLAADKVGKPGNLTIVQSALLVNECEKPVNEYIDKVFTVYTGEYLEENNIKSNCAGLDCAACASCYLDKDVKNIIEQLRIKNKRNR